MTNKNKNKKDKYGYPIPDKYAAVRMSTENKSGTWRDDEFEDLLLDIIKMIEKKYPNDPKMQKTVLITLPSMYATHLLQKEITIHEQGGFPRYRNYARAILNLYESFDVPKEAILLQLNSIRRYLEHCPKLNAEEEKEEWK